jgi:hypothetical protein
MKIQQSEQSSRDDSLKAGKFFDALEAIEIRAQVSTVNFKRATSKGRGTACRAPTELNLQLTFVQ